MKKMTATFAEKMKIVQKLNEICLPVGDGLFKYNAGWTDLRVAELFQKTDKIVAYVRREVLGNLTAHDGAIKVKSENRDFDKRLTQIEDYLTRKNPAWRAAEGGLL